ncbi:MAG: hypothetical protein EP348_12785 [Alphaproteobacteria bacterium]|nr:MAG: hypothetical protein EP348_12785 [Alphaproteobacteria bacterium]
MFLTFVAGIAFLAVPAFASANEYEAGLRKLIDTDIRTWAQSDEVVSAIKAQNAANASLDQSGVDAKDKEWRAEIKGGDQKLINAVLGNALSGYLKGIKDKSEGLYTEIFVMDNKGLNVGQSDITSDYWQGDEAKWQKSYGAGPDGVLIDEVEFDDSSQTYQSQVSITIVDPGSKKPIGAVTVGVNIELLD